MRCCVFRDEIEAEHNEEQNRYVLASREIGRFETPVRKQYYDSL